MTLENVKKTVFLILLLIITVKVNASDDDAQYIKYTKEIMGPFIRECEKTYHIHCIGTGGQFAKNVACINLNFIAYRKGTIEEARELQVKMIESLLSKVNVHEKIRPFLSEYPFKTQNIDISVAFRKNDDSRYVDGSVALIFLGRNNTLFYSIEDPKTGKLIDIIEEPYEEALKIVNGKSLEIK